MLPPEVDFNQRLDQFRTIVDQRLIELVPHAESQTERIHAAMKYALLAPGKRLRPILSMACAEAVGGQTTDALDAGCAIEMIHCFSLIHDDLPAIDNDDLRRGRPTLHKAFDEMTAILASDAIFALAFETLSLGSQSALQKVEAVKIVAQAVGSHGLVGGEFADCILEGSTPTQEAVEFIHPRKTGKLIAASCQLGAIFGGGTNAQIEALNLYGEHLGLAFQIADDLLNETSTEDQLGKAVGSDRALGKQTYPAVFGLEKSAKIATDLVASAKSALATVGIQDWSLTAMADYSLNRLN